MQKIKDSLYKKEDLLRPISTGRHYTMSPNQNFFVKSGKGGNRFTRPVQYRRQNNWETFRGSKSVNSHTVVKDVHFVSKVDTRKIVTVKCELDEHDRSKFVYREVFESQTRILVYGSVYTRRADGVFREISKDAIKQRSAKKVSREKMENEIKSIVVNGKSYRIIRKKK